MSVTVEKLDNLERKVILSLNWDDIKAKVNARMKVAQKRARVDGFRPGKAPLKMIDAMYGYGIRDEVLNEMTNKAFEELIVAEKLKVAGLKSLSALEEAEQDDDKVYKIAVVFEEYPEIKIGDLAAQEVTKVSTEIGEAEIDKTVEILRQQRTRFNHVERAAQNNDRVIIDFAGKIDGEAFAGGTADNYAFMLGKEQMLPDFEAGVLGMKENDIKEVSVTFPEDYQSKDVAGKTAVFTITLKNVSEAVLPEVNEEFAKSLGIADGDVSKMRAEIKKNVEREVNRRVNEMTKESAINALLASTPIEVPSTIVAEESKNLAERMKENFAAQGMDNKDLNLPLEMFNDQAKRRVSISLAMGELVREQKLEPTEEQIKKIVTEFADSYEDPQEVIDWYFSDRKNLQGPTSLAIEQNVVDYILSKAKVTDKTMSFDEVMGQQVQA